MANNYGSEQMTARENVPKQQESWLVPCCAASHLCSIRLKLRRQPLWQFAEALEVYRANGLISLLLLYSEPCVIGMLADSWVEGQAIRSKLLSSAKLHGDSTQYAWHCWPSS